jgi:glycosyltransferase involved in cell wall biosynthesis
MRIAYVTSIHPDFDSRVWKYAVMMARRQHEVHLVCPWQVQDGEVRDGVMLHTFARARSRASRPFTIPFRLLRKLLPIRNNVDVVHFHDLDIMPIMAVLALFKPIVYDVHENYPEEMLVRQWIPKALRRPLYHCVGFIQSILSRVIRNAIFVIPEIEDVFPKKGLRTAIIRNFATLDLLDKVAPDYLSRRDAVIFLASNYEGNGTFLFLQIAAALKKSRPATRFLMVDRWSDAATKTRAEEIIAKEGLTNVSVLPNIPPQDIMKYLNQATIGISATLRLPTHINALPTKLFEYMAAGLPIVSSDLPNAKQFALDTGAILLCRPEEPETFVSAIESLVANRQKACELGQSGQRAFRTRFCWESQADTLEQFYAGILGNVENSLHPLNFDRVKQ